ncbi:Uncharacterised protein [Mycobacteroides abscessus subsp. abscessus]|nr:Uncharacterised protein [Mycobacteroides abscessus subsp. abscessus]
MVEALVATDVTDFGVGDNDIREARGRDQHISHGCNDHPLVHRRQC